MKHQQLSRTLRSEGMTRIPPIDSVEHIGQLRGRDSDYAASSGTIGTTSLPISGFFSSARRIETNPMVVDTPRPPDPSVHSLKNFSSGTLTLFGGTDRVGMYPPSSRRRCCIYTISGESCGGR